MTQFMKQLDQITTEFFFICWVRDTYHEVVGRSDLRMRFWSHAQMMRLPTWCLQWNTTYKVEKEMATHSSILAWRIPWTGEPGGLQSMGLQNWPQLSTQHTTYKAKAKVWTVGTWMVGKKMKSQKRCASNRKSRGRGTGGERITHGRLYRKSRKSHCS